LLKQIKSMVATARTLGGAVVTSVWSRIGGLGIGSRLRYLMPGARFDYERQAGDTWMNSVVAICIKWVGDNYRKPTLEVRELLKDGSKLVMPNHLLVKLCKKPNPHYGGRTLWKAVALSLICDGNAYLVKIRNGYGQPVQLYWVPHWLIQPVWPEDGSTYIRAYQFLRDYEVVEIPRENVIHIRDGIDPRNDRLGLAAVKAQMREICSDNESSGYTATIMRNLGVPGVVVMPKLPQQKIDSPAAKKIKEKIRDSATGEDRGDTMVFNEQIELVKIAFSPEELRLDKLPARAEARISAAIGVSCMVVGLPDPNKTYSNYAEANSAAWRHCLVPMGDVVAEALEFQLLPEFDNPDQYEVGYDYTHVEALQEDLAQKHGRVREDWKAGLIEQNEAREQLGFDPHPDGDRFYPGTDASDAPPALSFEQPPPPNGDAQGDDNEEENDDEKDQ
jgi:HK97 family phage portal protein